MQPSIHVFRFLLAASVFLSACGDKAATKQEDSPQDPPADQSGWELAWDEAPASNTEKTKARLVIKAEGDIEVVDVDPQMPTHGHGTVESYQKIEPVACEGVVGTCFTITGFFFVMPGPWEINITIRYNGEEMTQTFPVEVK